MNKPYKTSCSRCKKNLYSSRSHHPILCSKCRGKDYVCGWENIKKSLIDKACQICKGNKKLLVHHLDCNKRNNQLSNLITLCNQCHMSIHAKYKRNKLKNNNIKDLFPKSVEQGLYGVRLLYN